MVPVIAFFATFRFLKMDMFPISLGNDPLRLQLYMLKLASECKFPISDGIVPVKSGLLRIISSRRSDSWNNSAGIVPVAADKIKTYDK